MPPINKKVKRDTKGGRLEFIDHYKGKYFFDTAIYVEYYIPKKEYKDYEELEIRLIFEKDFGNFRLDINPMIEKKRVEAKSSKDWSSIMLSVFTTEKIVLFNRD